MGGGVTEICLAFPSTGPRESGKDRTADAALTDTGADPAAAANTGLDPTVRKRKLTTTPIAAGNLQVLLVNISSSNSVAIKPVHTPEMSNPCLGLSRYSWSLTSRSLS